MKTKAIVISIGLAVVYVVLIVVAGSVKGAFPHQVLIALASAIFGAGLTFFLIRITDKN